jgi:hypothetical protein
MRLSAPATMAPSMGSNSPVEDPGVPQALGQVQAPGVVLGPGVLLDSVRVGQLGPVGHGPRELVVAQLARLPDERRLVAL